MRTRYVTYLRHQLRHCSRGRQAELPLPGSRGVPAWNRYLLVVIPIRIRNRYINTNEDTGKMHECIWFNFWRTFTAEYLLNTTRWQIWRDG